VGHALIRNLMKLHEETGLSKEEIVEKYVFLGGGGQCGPCRYGMYPHEYLKVVNEAGFEGFRILIFSSDINDAGLPPRSAIQFNLQFRINMLIAIVLADLMHVTECALRPYAEDGEQVTAVIRQAEQMLYDAFRSRLFFFKIPRALRKVGRMFAAVPRRELDLPLIFITGEFFANLAHNDGNYHLRRFISEEGCEVIPGLMTQRILYDNWRREQEALRGQLDWKLRTDPRVTCIEGVNARYLTADDLPADTRSFDLVTIRLESPDGSARILNLRADVR